jgi:hypothetical protein
MAGREKRHADQIHGAAAHAGIGDDLRLPREGRVERVRERTEIEAEPIVDGIGLPERSVREERD